VDERDGYLFAAWRSMSAATSSGLFGHVVSAVLDNLDLHVGPAVVARRFLGQSRHDRAEDVLDADEQQRNVDGAGAPALGVMLAGRAR
jgi:hypothetical protein